MTQSVVTKRLLQVQHKCTVGLLHLIEKERNGEVVNRGLLGYNISAVHVFSANDVRSCLSCSSHSNLLRMYAALQIYNVRAA